MRVASSTFNLRIAAGLLSLAVGLMFAPVRLTDPIRNAVRDATGPGQQLYRLAVRRTDRFTTRWQLAGEQADEWQRLQAQTSAWERRCRRLQIENGLLRERLHEARYEQGATFEASRSQPLLVPELLEANVLGEETADAWRRGRFIAAGEGDGVAESALVLDGDEPMIDQGLESKLATGQPVYSGRVVIGRVSAVGRLVSTVQPVTDPEYRALAQLARPTSQGLVFGPCGRLEGRGEELCRLTLIAPTEAVEVGDEVYTSDRDSTLPYPMYYGRVVRAKLRPGAPEWDIWIRPAAVEIDPKTVQVLRRRLNPLRPLAE